jgi:hypothetical protein
VSSALWPCQRTTANTDMKNKLKASTPFANMNDHEIRIYSASAFDFAGGVATWSDQTASGKAICRLEGWLLHRDRTILQALRDYWDLGSVGSQPHSGKARAFRWKLSSAAIARFLKGVYPYLRVKRREAEVAIEFGLTIGVPKGPRGIPRETVRKREQLARRLTTLKAALPQSDFGSTEG